MPGARFLHYWRRSDRQTAVVVDPQRDIDQYMAFADEHGLKIKHVFLTHLHADFVAGHLELRDRVGATIYLGAAGKGGSIRLLRCVMASPQFGRVRLKGAGNAGPHAGIDLHPHLRLERQRN